MLLIMALHGMLGMLLVLLWEGVRQSNGAEWSWEAVAWRLVLVLGALCLGRWAASGRRRWIAVVGFLLPTCLVAGWRDLHQADTRLA